MAYRVIYGETMPAWEQCFPTQREAKAFAKEHESFGDVIFSISKVVPGEGPRSIMAVLQENNDKNGDGAPLRSRLVRTTRHGGSNDDPR